MFLLSNRLIKHYIKRSDSSFDIDGFDESALGATCYYFRLHPRIEFWTEEKGHQVRDISKWGDKFEVEPRATVRVVSFEKFTLPLNVMAMIGNHSAMTVDDKLLMIHGMSIDPNYKAARLAVNLVNLGDEPATLETRQRVGKVMFFDISDTGLEDAAISAAALDRNKLIEKDDL